MRSLVRVDMDAHDTTVSPKVSSRTTVAALPDAAVAGRHPVPILFRSGSASSPPAGIRPCSGGSAPQESGVGRHRTGAVRDLRPEEVPTEFRRSDVKVPAVECLCAVVVERPPDPACPCGRAAEPGGPGPQARRPASDYRLRVLTTPPRDGPSRAPGTSVVPTWRKRGVPSLSIEPTTADVKRSTAWPRAGLRGRRLPRHRRPARAPSGDPRQGRRHGP